MNNPLEHWRTTIAGIVCIGAAVVLFLYSNESQAWAAAAALVTVGTALVASKDPPQKPPPPQEPPVD